ncbi:nucleotide sugar dehydrogenase [Gammaproteobacteria bacterium]|nr:nucleotide sugar dehydrogenase [Gammaproteobacteria bacterium]MDA9174455.1 nucleotide sugar dehydrogenase [Gammaproteobacteria bacterium]MDA9834621.1 nucleotide sugar dehydrogenase [Gammaproteobacteria bacterium]MDC3371963.1 nucleotide sugar dehydrogenase [Gammaproteobacteria bacterium]
MKKIAVIGAGYVGFSLAVLLAQFNKVMVHDINLSRVNQVNNKQSTIADQDIDNFLETKELDIRATINFSELFDTDFFIVATPTDYDVANDYFDTSSVEEVIKKIFKINKTALIVIKSTVPVGFTKKICHEYDSDRIIFSPEFLREGSALHDNLYPSRIIIGSEAPQAIEFANLLVEGSHKDNVSLLYTESDEAEAIKLFANTYLAMRVAFFNELDSYSLFKNLDAKKIIDGVCLDPRIGNFYNNPSFGYGGYCLPKDTQQLLANYQDIPQNLIQATVEANKTRIEFLAAQILALKPNIVGIFRLTMKSGSDNFRSSSVQGIMQILISEGVRVIIYEPATDLQHWDGLIIFNDLSLFKQDADIIIANRRSEELTDVEHKVFSRDIYQQD